MDNERITNLFESAIIKAITKGDCFKIDYNDRIDVSPEIKKAYDRIDFSRIRKEITERLEEEIARKIVNKVITEMGNDIKGLMARSEIRDEFKYILRRSVEKMIEAANSIDQTVSGE